MKSLCEILKRPTRIIFLLVAIGLLSFPFYFYELTSVKNAIVSFTGISNSGYLNLVQIVEICGWSSFIGVFSEYFWQIESNEYKKFLPLAIMGSSIIFIYTVCRQAKDSMIYGLIQAETVSFAKILVIILNAVYFSFYYTKLSRKTHYKNYLLVGMLPIIAYFVVFNFYLFGNTDVIPSPTTVAIWMNYISNTFPKILIPSSKHFVSLFAHWPVTLYYVFSEVFSACVLSTVFWKLANRFVTKTERSRFYPAIMITAQIASLLSGMFVQAACSAKVTISSTGYKIASYGPVINKITLIVTVLAAILVITNWFFFSKVVHEDQDPIVSDDKKKININIIDTIKKNPKYLFIALLTVYYGFCSVFMEQFWKDKIRTAYPGAINYSNFISKYIILQSRVSLIVAMFVSNLLMRYTSWFVFAAVTPVLTIIGSAVLFLPFIFETTIMKLLDSFSFTRGTTIGIAVCVIGSLVIAAFKAVKYGSFDPSKEEYIAQQDFDSRREIKNLEGATSKLGKAGGSVLLAILFGATDLTYRSPSVAIGLFVATMAMGVIWFITVASISKDVTE